MTISFMHSGTPAMASYRYRAARPAEFMGATLNDPTAELLVFSKPTLLDVVTATRKLGEGGRVIVDFCDDHFGRNEYIEMLHLASLVTCPTLAMRGLIRRRLGGWRQRLKIEVIPEPYEFDERLPHVRGDRTLWFGHPSNLWSLAQVNLAGLPAPRIVSNFTGAIPWSLEALQQELGKADLVLMPATAAYKSANRTVEAVRQGCFVVAEPHPSLRDLPGIWMGDVRQGVEWARGHAREANIMVAHAQAWVRERFSLRTVGMMWQDACHG